MSFFSSKKPRSAVTVAISRLVHDELLGEDDVIGIPELVESIALQSTGPSEAARAIRKKLKYGNVNCQLRALTILDGLIQNCGPQFQRTFVDEMLLERLRVCGISNHSDPWVKAKCEVIFKSWAAQYKNTQGFEQLAVLYKQLPRHKQAVTLDKSKALKETEQNPFEDGDHEEEEKEETVVFSPSQSQNSQSPRSPVRSSWSSLFSSPKQSSNNEVDKKKDKQKKVKAFHHIVQKSAVKGNIAEASLAATSLMNTMRLINREKEQISQNKTALELFETCKRLRKKILIFIQSINDEEWLGALLHANDELVAAIITFEQLDKSVDADSDSEDELARQRHLSKMIPQTNMEKYATNQLAGLHIHDKSPTEHPKSPSVEAHKQINIYEDDDNPFADKNAVATPKVEQMGFGW